MTGSVSALGASAVHANGLAAAAPAYHRRRMGGLLRFLLFLAIAVTLLAVVVVQVVVPAVVTAAVRASLGSLASPVSVQVRTSLDGVLLHGRIDAISVSGGPLQHGDVLAADVQLTASEVALADRSIGAVDGTLRGVQLEPGDGRILRLGSAQVSGGPGGIELVGNVAPGDVTTDLQLALQGAIANPLGSAPRVTLDGGSIHIVAGSANVAATLRVDGGSLVLDGGSLGTVTILPAPADGSWRLTAATLSPAGLRVTAVMPLGAIPGFG
jgi:hypothetical protein